MDVPYFPPRGVATFLAREDESHARWWALPLGVAVVIGFALLDAALGDETIIISTVVIAPFLAALVGSPRQTLVVTIAAIAATVLSGAWNDNTGDDDYVIRIVIVTVASAFAVLSAGSRVRLARDGQRFALLLSVSDLASVERIGAHVVPALADLCVIDVFRSDDRPADRVAVVVDPSLGSAAEARLRAAQTSPASSAPARPELLEAPSAARLWPGAWEPAEESRLGLRSALRVPLHTRGRRIGAMVLATTRASGRRFTQDDLAFADVLGGRVALALDNAGLLSALELVEAQRTGALEALAEAVIVQDATGDWVYVNAAAVRLLGYDSAQAVLDTPRRDLLARFATFHEDGRPLADVERPGRRVFEGGSLEPVLLRVVEHDTGREHWWMLKASAINGPDGRPALAVNVVEDVTEVKRAETVQRFLAEAGELLAASLDYEETLGQIAQLVVPRLADWCIVSIPDAEGVLRSVAVAHHDPERVAFVEAFNERYPARLSDAGGAGQVLREGRSRIVNDISQERLGWYVDEPEQRRALRALGIRAVMVVPMVGPRGPIGAITFISATSGRAFTEADRLLAEEIGRRAGTAVENARLYTERSHIALTLQTSLLPDVLPEIPGLRLAALYRPSGEESFVGGDFFDVVPTATGWIVFIGDVTGRGVEAAALTGRARHTLRTAGRTLGGPVAAVEELNRSLVEQRTLDLCTVAVVHVGEVDGARRATITRAGHPAPLLVRGGAVTEVGAPGPMVGAWESSAWTSTTVALEPGDLLVLFTDGVTDTVGAQERFGGERLAAALAPATDAQDAVTRLRGALEAFEHGPQADDNAALVIELLGADAAGAPQPVIVSPVRR